HPACKVDRPLLAKRPARKVDWPLLNNWTNVLLILWAPGSSARRMGSLARVASHIQTLEVMAKARSDVSDMAERIHVSWAVYFNLFNGASNNCRKSGYSQDQNSHRNWNFPQYEKVPNWQKRVWIDSPECKMVREVGKMLFPSSHKGGELDISRIPIKTSLDQKLSNDELVMAYCFSISNMLSVSCHPVELEQNGQQERDCRMKGTVYQYRGEPAISTVHETNMFTMKKVMSECEAIWAEQLEKDLESEYVRPPPAPNGFVPLIPKGCLTKRTGSPQFVWNCWDGRGERQEDCMFVNRAGYGNYGVYVLEPNYPCGEFSGSQVLKFFNAMFPRIISHEGMEIPNFFINPPLQTFTNKQRVMTKIKSVLGNRILDKLEADYEIFKQKSRPSGQKQPEGKATEEVLDLVMNRGICRIDYMILSNDHYENEKKRKIEEWKTEMKLVQKGMLPFSPILERAASDICIDFWVKYINSVMNEAGVTCGPSCPAEPQSDIGENLKEATARHREIGLGRGQGSPTVSTTILTRVVRLFTPGRQQLLSRFPPAVVVTPNIACPCPGGPAVVCVRWVLCNDRWTPRREEGSTRHLRARQESIEYKVSLPWANYLNYNGLLSYYLGCDTTHPGMNDIGQGHVISIVGPIRADKSEGEVRLLCRLS
ncbi:hypothetical protein THAOC_11214, partial [Thalassiosira oceanica]